MPDYRFGRCDGRHEMFDFEPCASPSSTLVATALHLLHEACMRSRGRVVFGQTSAIGPT
jgi:hypothetical protein